MGISRQLGKHGIIPRPRPPAQSVTRTRPRRGSPPAFALLSPPRTASTPPNHQLPCCPEPWPLRQGRSPRSQAGSPALRSQATARLTARPHGTDLWVAPHPQSVHTTCPLPSMPSPPPSPSSRLCPILQGQFRCRLLREACSDPSMPWDPPTSSALDWASPGEVTPASLLVPFHLSLWPFLLHLVLTGTCHPSPLCCVFWLLFSCLCRLSLSSNLCSPWSFLYSVLLP